MTCALAHRSRCNGPTEGHHVIPQQRIKQARKRALALDRASAEPIATVPLSAVLADERNIVPLCRAHHHLITVGARHLQPDELPSEVYAFATDYGLGWSLERDLRYAEGEAA